MGHSLGHFVTGHWYCQASMDTVSDWVTRTVGLLVTVAREPGDHGDHGNHGSLRSLMVGASFGHWVSMCPLGLGWVG